MQILGKQTFVSGGLASQSVCIHYRFPWGTRLVSHGEEQTTQHRKMNAEVEPHVGHCGDSKKPWWLEGSRPGRGGVTLTGNQKKEVMNFLASWPFLVLQTI